MTLWITYVVNDVTMAVSMVTGFYHGICDLNMLLGSNHSRDWYMEQWMAGTPHFGIEPDPVFVILFYGDTSDIHHYFAVYQHYQPQGCTEDR